MFRPSRISFILCSSMLIFFHLPMVFGAERAFNLTLRESLRLALANNLTKKKADLEQISAELETDRIKTATNLKVDVSATGNRQLYFYEGVSGAYVYNDTTSQIQLQKILFPNRDINHSIKIADIENLEGIYQSHLTKNEVIFNTKILYWKIVILNKLAKIGENKVERYKAVVDFSESKEKYGFGIRLDTDWAKVQFGLAQDDLTETLNELNLTEVVFRQTLGLPQHSPIDLRDDLPYDGSATSISPIKMEENDPSIKIAKLQIEKAKQNQEYSKKRLLPNLSISGTLNQSDGESTSLGFDTNWNLSFIEGYPIRYDIPVYYQNNYFFGFNVSYPLFDGGYSNADYKHASSIVKSEQNNLDLTRNKRETELVQDKLNYENAINRVRHLYQISVISKGNVDAANIKFKEGEYSLVQLVNVESDNATAQKKYIEALYDLNVVTESLRKNLFMEEYKSDPKI